MTRIERTDSAEDALRAARPRAWEAPQREQMLTQVYLRAQNTKENPMTIFDKLFAGRHITARLAIAAALLLMLAVLAVMLPRPSALAATDGVVLSYDLTALGDHQATIGKLKGVKESLALPEGADLKIIARVEARAEHQVSADNTGEAPKERTNGGLRGEVQTAVLAVQLTGADEGTVVRLREAIAAAAPELSEPTVQDATWFREQGAGFEGGIAIGLNIGGSDRLFNFPEGTSEEQMENEIRAWLAQKHPGKDYAVDVSVTKTGSGSEVQTRIEVKIEDGE